MVTASATPEIYLPFAQLLAKLYNALGEVGSITVIRVGRLDSMDRSHGPVNIQHCDGAKMFKIRLMDQEPFFLVGDGTSGYTVDRVTLDRDSSVRSLRAITQLP